MRRRIAKVYVFSNGMCMVFDNLGNQMSEYQGPGGWNECRARIERDKDESTVIEGAHWGSKAIALMPVEDAEQLAKDRGLV